MTAAVPSRFDDASRVVRLDDERFTTDVPDGWQQGRGAYGGLGIGIALRALEQVEATWPIRAVTAELPAPLMPGPAGIRVTVLRRGSGLAVLEAHVVQGDEVKVRASATFGRARDETTSFAPAPPTIPDPHAVPIDPPTELAPPFTRFFEYRNTGPQPFQRGPEPVVEGFLALRERTARFGVPEIAAMADAYYPAPFTTWAMPRPMATVTYTLQLGAVAHALSMEGPLFYRARAIASLAGFVAEQRELWTLDAQLVALNLQTFAIIR